MKALAVTIVIVIGVFLCSAFPVGALLLGIHFDESAYQRGGNTLAWREQLLREQEYLDNAIEAYRLYDERMRKIDEWQAQSLRAGRAYRVPVSTAPDHSCIWTASAVAYYPICRDITSRWTSR